MSQLSFIQNLGLKLLGAEALAAIKADVVTVTRTSVTHEESRKPLTQRVPRHLLETFFGSELFERVHTGANQVASAYLLKLVGGNDEAAYQITNAARIAEASGEGFMKKKAAVLKVVREQAPGLKKSIENLVIELAVQLTKD